MFVFDQHSLWSIFTRVFSVSGAGTEALMILCCVCDFIDLMLVECLCLSNIYCGQYFGQHSIWSIFTRAVIGAEALLAGCFGMSLGI